MTQSRTHNCNELRLSNAGEKVTLVGWYENLRKVSRNLGFLILRDFYGTTQIVVETEEMMEKLDGVNKESTISVTGTVRERSNKNTELPTGEIEVVPEGIEILGKCIYNALPFEINQSREADENTRLKYRYLDLRNPNMKKNIVMRSQIVAELRQRMYALNFMEITTPILTCSSPEGARDYLVPSRIHPGSFYGLPQSPQLYKQLLMCSGFDRYIQIARCFRDEDLRADRQPEFTQIDMELSFVDVDDVIDVNERYLAFLFKEVLDIDVKKLCFEENEDINITEYTQAAMVTASVAILKKIEEMGLKPDLTAGLSLGEYCALVASDVMSFEDAVKVVRQRGILMQDTVPAGEGAMSAVLGMKKEAIEAVLPDVEGIVTIANYNCPGQIVISGESKAVAEAGEALKEAGAKRVLPLKVSGPFHSPMLKPAGEKLLDVLADVEVDDPTVPYVSNTTAEFITSKDEVKELLGRQVYSSVCWEQSIEKMIADGADTFVEIGPGRTLCGFMRKIDRNVKAINIAKVEDLEKLKEIM